MAWLVFGGCKRTLRAVLVFFAVSAAFGGVILAVLFLEGQTLYDALQSPVSVQVLLLSFALTYLAVWVVFRRTANVQQEVVQVEAVAHGRRVTFPALVDTGNGLMDPMTGTPVVVAEIAAVRSLLPTQVQKQFESAAVCDAPEVFAALPQAVRQRFRLLPYHALGGGGLLLAMRMDSITIRGKRLQGALLAITPEKVSDGGAYVGLVGSDW